MSEQKPKVPKKGAAKALTKKFTELRKKPFFAFGCAFNSASNSLYPHNATYTPKSLFGFALFFCELVFS